LFHKNAPQPERFCDDRYIFKKRFSRMENIVIIGGGGTGAALAHDLALRGYSVTLLERGGLLSGTTGRHHGLLHSGARYAVNDPQAARECVRENRCLRQIAPDALEQNDGLFVALNAADMDYLPDFLDACEDCGIETLKIPVAHALMVEPRLNPALRAAVRVPDATMDAWRLPMHFFATARANGARIEPFREVVGIHQAGGAVTGVQVRDHAQGREYRLDADLVVNAGGPWAGKIASLAGVEIPIQPGPGVMVGIRGRMTKMVVNRMHPAGEGDIVVPQRQSTLLGTTLWLAQDPDKIRVPEEHPRRVVALCSELVPDLKKFAPSAVWWAARPLIADPGAADAQTISRTFDCYDHAVRDRLEGLVSVIGGKATTLRAMAEKTADLVCRKTGRRIACRTRGTRLLHYRAYFKSW
jgi:glycerol-3-phosphate dehydrogenase